MITVKQEQLTVIVKQESRQVVVQQMPFPQITIQGVAYMGQVMPFSFTCTTPGQTVFGPLPGSAVAVLALGISGTIQNQSIGDYSIQNNNIVLSQGLSVGQTVYGTIEI